MKDTNAMRGSALKLMRQALALLDEAREYLAAVHRQQACDIAAHISCRSKTSRDRDIIGGLN